MAAQCNCVCAQVYYCYMVSLSPALCVCVCVCVNQRGPSIPSPAVSSTCGLSKEGITSQDIMNWKSQTAFLHGKLQINCTVNIFAKLIIIPQFLDLFLV